MKLGLMLVGAASVLLSLGKSSVVFFGSCVDLWVESVQTDLLYGLDHDSSVLSMEAAIAVGTFFSEDK